MNTTAKRACDDDDVKQEVCGVAVTVAADDGRQPLKRSCPPEDGERLCDALLSRSSAYVAMTSETASSAPAEASCGGAHPCAIAADCVGLQARNGDIFVLPRNEARQHLPLIDDVLDEEDPEAKGVIIPLPCIDTVQPLAFLAHHRWLQDLDTSTPFGALFWKFPWGSSNHLDYFGDEQIDLLEGVSMDMVQQAAVMADYCRAESCGVSRWQGPCLARRCLTVLTMQIIAASLVPVTTNTDLDVSSMADSNSDEEDIAPTPKVKFAPDWVRMANALERRLPRGWLLPPHLLEELANSKQWSYDAISKRRVILTDAFGATNVGVLRCGTETASPTPLVVLLRHLTKWMVGEQHIADGLAAAYSNGLVGFPSLVKLDPDVDPTGIFAALGNTTPLARNVGALKVKNLGGRHLASIATSVNRRFRETFKTLDVVVDDAAMETTTPIFDVFPNLAELRLDVNDEGEDQLDDTIEPSMVSRFFGGGDKLDTLVFVWPTFFHADTLGAITACCPNLVTLDMTVHDIEAVDNFEDEELAPALSRLPRLTSLDMPYFVQLGDASLRALARGSPHLKRLGVERSTITDRGLDKLLAVHSRHDHDTLDYLDISHCHNLTDGGRLRAMHHVREARFGPSDYGLPVVMAMARRDLRVQLPPTFKDDDVAAFLASLEAVRPPEPPVRMRQLETGWWTHLTSRGYLRLMTSPTLASLIDDMQLHDVVLEPEDLEVLQVTPTITASRIGTFEIASRRKPRPDTPADTTSSANELPFDYAACAKALFAIHPALRQVRASQLSQTFERADCIDNMSCIETAS